MEEKLKKALIEKGVDVDTTVERFSGNEALYMKYLFKFPEEPTYYALAKAHEEKNRAAIAQHAHTLKGVSGNLGMIDLYLACSDIVITLASNINSDIEEKYQKVEKLYTEITDFIKNRDDRVESKVV